jgi:hypothetical protein
MLKDFAYQVSGLTSEERLELAKSKMKQVVDHFLYLLQLHENNAIIVYSEQALLANPRVLCCQRL